MAARERFLAGVSSDILPPRGMSVGLGMISFRIGVLVASGLCAALGQSDSVTAPLPPSTDYQIYSDFFHDVQSPANARLRLMNSESFRAALAAGKPTGATPAEQPPTPVPSVQDIAGLTDREMNDVRGIAADCEQRLANVGSDQRHFAWEALMESIETGEDKMAEVEQTVRDQQAQRERIVLAHTQVLKAALGDARFKELDARLRAEVVREAEAMKTATGIAAKKK